MEIVSSISRMQELSALARRDGRIIGFVPTMGYLHEGHLSLMRIARKKCDVLVVSIFVNPTQFGAGEDLAQYPRNIERDKKLCREEGVDVIFLPDEREMYPENYSTYVEVSGNITNVLCGYFRPGHFRGVATVVAKLLNIVQPHFAVFGQKDGQQLAVIRRMVRDLNYPVEIVGAPTVREPDGLAMSSRNEYLTPKERKVAPKIYESLMLAEKMIQSGIFDPEIVKDRMRRVIEEAKMFRIQYVEIVDAETLEPVKKIESPVMVAVAAFLGKARLIDNIVVNPR
ncbi:pantoate--beta-alanine ligase [bacterium]|nr:pantoate--beta-alanine ligase [bacterium]